MTTATDDINARLAAVEADIRNINTRQSEMHADIRPLDASFDRLNHSIDRLFYAVIAMGSGIIVTLVGGFVGLIIRLG